MREGDQRPRFPKLWWKASAIALCAAGGSLAWGAWFLSSPNSDESWTAWASKATAGVLIGLFFIEPLAQYSRVGRLPVTSISRFRSATGAAKAILSGVGLALLADAYRDGIIKSFDSVAEWGATSILIGLITYAWLRAIGAPYVEAAHRTDWFALLGVLGFTLFYIIVDVNRFNEKLIPGVAWSDQIEALPWIDMTVNQYAFRTAIWSSIGRVGIWILARSSRVEPVKRLMLAALATGFILEAGYGLGLSLNRSLAATHFKTSPGEVLFHPVFITAAWCLGIWLVMRREFKHTEAPIGGVPAVPLRRIGHTTLVTLLGIAVVVVALVARIVLSPLAYSDARIEFVASAQPSADPYGLHNLMTYIPGKVSTTRYVHAIVTVFHTPGQRARKIPVMCGLGDTKKPFIQLPPLLVDVPDKVSGPGQYPKTSWIVRFGYTDYQWKPGLYKVVCQLPRGPVAADFQLDP
jgi:hypothetical protein